MNETATLTHLTDAQLDDVRGGTFVPPPPRRPALQRILDRLRKVIDQII